MRSSGSIDTIELELFKGCEKTEKINLSGNKLKIIDSPAFYNTGFYNNPTNWKGELLYFEDWGVACNLSLDTYLIKSNTFGIAKDVFLKKHPSV